MKVLLHADEPAMVGSEIDDETLRRLYAAPAESWLRANMIATLDGSASGPDGRSGTINNDPDHAVFSALRSLADAVVVGAGTARAEGYSPVERPIVLVSRSGDVPPRLRDAEPGRVLLATTATSTGLPEARRLLGDEHVLVVGDDAVDLPELRRALAERGHHQLLSEGGPSLLADLLAAGSLDELCLTVVPTLLGGDHPRILRGPEVGARLVPTLLLEHEGTVLGRWRVER
jgi:riboflavin biosynthesis pyrimidine reductase